MVRYTIVIHAAHPSMRTRMTILVGNSSATLSLLLAVLGRHSHGLG